MSKAAWFRIGQIAGPYGVRGEMRVKCQADDQEQAMNLPTWWLGPSPDELREVEVVHVRRHGAGWVARLTGCETPEAVAAWSGLLIWAPRDCFPDPAPDQYYWEELTGCRVVEIDTGEDLGKVQGLFATGANDVLVVHHPDTGQERLLPFIQDVVIRVELAQQLLLVRLLPGL